MNYKLILFAIITSLVMVHCKGSSKLPLDNEKIQDKPIIEVLKSTVLSTVSTSQKGVVSYEYKVQVIVNKDKLHFDYMCAKIAWIDINVKKGNTPLPANYLTNAGDTLLLISSFTNNQLLASCADSLNSNEVGIHYSLPNAQNQVLKVSVSEKE